MVHVPKLVRLHNQIMGHYRGPSAIDTMVTCLPKLGLFLSETLAPVTASSQYGNSDWAPSSDDLLEIVTTTQSAQWLIAAWGQITDYLIEDRQANASNEDDDKVLAYLKSEINDSPALPKRRKEMKCDRILGYQSTLQLFFTKVYGNGLTTMECF
jgi:hypothetical protein